MNQIICIVLSLMLIGFVIFDFFKDKKTYRLLAIIPFLLLIFFQTPLSNGISKTATNMMVAAGSSNLYISSVALSKLSTPTAIRYEK